jgi:asparagine synthase (glutamine-hydrolysing)
MCGIAGFFAYSDSANPVSPETLTNVRDRMISRGPDGAGLWMDDNGRAGLAHRRLSIIDLSAAADQPLRDATGRYIIVFNGEIYNYRELAAELRANGRTLRTQSDTEVLVTLFAQEGPAMLSKLRGMFAFAIWDESDRSLFLARDPYGIKPLYFANDHGCFKFASQVKALLADPSISREPSAGGWAGFELLGSVPDPFTPFKAIRSCPAGSYIQVNGGGQHEAVSYAPLADCYRQTPRSGSKSASELLKDTVQAHLVADVEVGVFLSGGVDSAAILGLARDCTTAPIRGCTLAFEEFVGTPADETPKAREIAHYYNADHHVRMVTKQEFEEDLPLIFDAMDQPSVDGINSWFVSKACREIGLKVALSGLGGDELFGGYSTFRTVPDTFRRFGPLARLPFFGRFMRTSLQRLTPGYLKKNPKAAGLFDHAGSWAGAYLLRRSVRLPHELSALRDPDFVHQGLQELDILSVIEKSVTPDPGFDLARVCLLESSHYMRNQLLRDSDWAGMAHSLEIRTPLADFQLLQSLAPMQREFVNGQGKFALANAPRKPVPESVVNAAKTGFQIPVTRWLGRTKDGTVDRAATRNASVDFLDNYAASIPL